MRTLTDGSNETDAYDNNRRCNFLIIAPANQLVVLSFNRLDTERNYDYVYAFDTGYDGTSASADQLW